MQDFGARLGAKLSGGEVIELVGDIGAGKTTFTKGLARGLGVSDDVQSPTFTISRIYETPSGIRLAHYDFYRLQDAGVMQMELAESVCDPHTITVIEWAKIVENVLPATALTIEIAPRDEMTRVVKITTDDERLKKISEELG
jgi:tRNA threonylcarbamoyladenosine biosynthesis protein TsaE